MDSADGATCEFRAAGNDESGFGGADGDRTRDLMTASHARSQLRYSPIGKGESIAEPSPGAQMSYWT